MIDNKDSEFQTVAEVAFDLKVSEKHVRRLMKSGKLPFYKFGHAVRIKRQDREKYQKSCLQKTPPDLKFLQTLPNTDI